MAQDFQQSLIDGVLGFLEPVEQAATDPVARRDLFAELGWETGTASGFPEPNLISALSSIGSAIATLRASLSTAPQSLSDVVAAFDAIRSGISSIEQLSTLTQNGAAADFGQVTQELLNLLLVNRIKNGHLAFYQLLRLLTVIRDQTTTIVASSAQPAIVQRRQVTFDRLDFGRVVELIQDPVGVLKREYDLQSGLVDPNATADLLFPRIAALLNALNIPARYGVDSDRAVDFGSIGNDLLAHTLTLFKSIPSIADGVNAGIGFAFALEQDLGLLVQPFGVVTFSDTIGRWLFEATLSADVPGVAVSSSGVTFPTVQNGTPPTSATLSLQLTRVPASADESNSPDGTSFATGSGQGTRLELGAFTIGATATLSTQDHDFGFNVDTGKSALVISGGDGDGFLASVLPAETKIDFQFGVGWSRKAGLRFSGSGSLELALPVNFSIGGVVTVSGVRLRIVAADGALTAAGLANIAIALGPVTASAEGVGVGTTLTFPGQSGSLGPADASLAFQPPTGVGIAIDTGSVSGGGFLFFDSTNGRYGGAIELLAYDISVKAFGLIETKVPGVPFSFVIVISAEFTPIQLGLGFTLDGVGGLLGINRTVDDKAVADAVKSGRLDHVLFPDDVVANAPAIISDLSALFPAADGRYLIGPMAKLSWLEIVHGTLGLILQWPSKALTILGTIDAVLPNEDNAIVLLKMDVGGTLDFPKKHFALDAVLDPDSRVGDFKISGSMAMRLDWGNQPNFALSIGGFNKSYNPPPGFPALRRMTVDLGAGVDLGHITLEGYTALTSNTAQVGARLDASVSKYGATLSGFVAFDAIIVFSPFQFSVDLSGGVHVDFHGVGFGMTLHGHISGPSPWLIDGEVCVSLLFADACVGFHEKLGGEAKPTLPSIDPWLGQPWSAGIAFADQDVGGLEPAIRDMRNWRGDLPPGAFVGVSYREQKPPVSRVDPVGVATFTQKVAPLDYPIDMFVGAPSGRTGELKITGATSGSVAATPSPVKDFFAPAQYKSMSDAEKLSSESFESLDAGVAIVSQAVSMGAVQGKTIEYRTFEIQAGGAIVERTDVHYVPSDAHLDGMATGSSAARPLVRSTGRLRFIDLTLPPKLTDQLETYLVVLKSSLTAVPGLATGVTRSQAAALLSAAAGSSVAQKRLYQVIPSSFLAAA